MYTYRTKGVCSRAINVEVEGDTIKHVDFIGGCNGNLKAISKLVEGKDIVRQSLHFVRRSALPRPSRGEIGRITARLCRTGGNAPYLACRTEDVPLQ